MTRIKLSAPRLHLPFSMLFNQDKHICLYRLELFNCISWSVHLFFCWGRRKEKGQDGAARGEGGGGGGGGCVWKGRFQNKSILEFLTWIAKFMHGIQFCLLICTHLFEMCEIEYPVSN